MTLWWRQPESDRLVIQRTPLVPKHSYELFATLGAGSRPDISSWAALTGKRGRLRVSTALCAWFQAVPMPHLVWPITAVLRAHTVGLRVSRGGVRVPASLRAFQCRETLSHVQRWCVLVSDRLWRQSLGWDQAQVIY